MLTLFGGRATATARATRVVIDVRPIYSCDMWLHPSTFVATLSHMRRSHRSNINNECLSRWRPTITKCRRFEQWRGLLHTDGRHCVHNPLMRSDAQAQGSTSRPALLWTRTSYTARRRNQRPSQRCACLHPAADELARVPIPTRA